MPYPNGHFHFLKEIQPNCIVDEEGRTLARISLTSPENQHVTVGDKVFTLLEHEIRLLPTTQAEKNTYHYVATIKDQNNDLFTVDISINPVSKNSNTISVINCKNNEEVVLSEMAKSNLINCAYIYTLPKMKVVHSNYENTLEERTKEFYLHMKQLFEQTASQPQINLDELITEAQMLENIGGPSRALLLKQYQLNLQNQSARAKAEIEAKKDDQYDKLNDLDDDFELEEVERFEAQRAEQEKQKQEKQAFEQIVAKLTSMRLSINQQSKICVRDAVEYNNTAKLALKLAEQPSINLDLGHLELIHNTNKESMTHCLKILTQALVANDKDIYLDPQLAPYAHEISSLTLVYLLNKNLTESFCWLVKAGSFAIDYLQSKSAKVLVSILEKAFILNNLDCFRALLEQQAFSLFISKAGRAFAHDILQGYPLFARILVETNASGAQQPSFFQNLIQLLYIWSENLPVNPFELHMLPNCVQIYARNKTTTNVDYYSNNLSILDNLDPELVATTGLTTLKATELRPIRDFQDAFIDYNAAYQAYQKAVSELSPNMSLVQKKKNVYTLTDKMKKKPTCEEQATPNVIIRNLRSDTDLLNQAVEIINLEKQVTEESAKPCNINPKKLSKTLKELKASFTQKQNRFEEITKTRFREVNSSTSDFIINLFSRAVVNPTKEPANNFTTNTSLEDIFQSSNGSGEASSVANTGIASYH
jgi:hypothetical protein